MSLVVYVLNLCYVIMSFKSYRGFYKFAGTVCHCATKHPLINTRVTSIPVAHRRTFTGTPQHRRKRLSDATGQPRVLTAMFISDKHWAHDVIEASGLTESSDGHKVVIFHVNPGNSVLIESLLQSCDHKQIAWEPRKLYGDYLKSQTEVYKTKFAFCSNSFAVDSQLKILDDVLSNDRTAVTEATYHAKIIGHVPDMHTFIPKLVPSLGRVLKFRLGKIAMIEPILIVTGSEYRLMTEAEHFWQKSRHARTAVYELFLRTDLLKTVPLSAFNHAKRVVLKTTTFDYDRGNMYVVRLSLHKDLSSVHTHEAIVGIMQLLRVISNMKSRRVIPAFEHLCPDIGIILLELGISMMDRFCDIPLNMWPEIYHAITTSSQFACSSLYHIIQQKRDMVVPA